MLVPLPTFFIPSAVEGRTTFMQQFSFRSAIPLLFVTLLALAACATPQRQPLPGTPADIAAPAEQDAAPSTEPAAPTYAREAGVRVLDFAELPGWPDADTDAALAAFQKSCPVVTRRADPSRLAISDDWLEPCAAATSAPSGRLFFESAFTPVAVTDASAFVTGYYEPEIEGCRTPAPGCNTPIYAKPDDLVRAQQPDPKNPGETKMMTGRIGEDGEFTLYWQRADIEEALSGRGLEIAYAKDPVELFFLHIQGSGRLRLPDGSVMRIGYAGQNGREYVGIGRRLREMDALAPGEASMQGIMRWLRANPEDGEALMNENKSYIFFQELTGEGPLGAMNVAVTPEVSLAADPKFVPLGAPVFLTTRYIGEDGRWHDFSKLMVAQDTGGAIKGANRFDLFWGAGERARTIAGGLSSEGTAYILVPNAAVRRLQGETLIGE